MFDRIYKIAKKHHCSFVYREDNETRNCCITKGNNYLDYSEFKTFTFIIVNSERFRNPDLAIQEFERKLYNEEIYSD